MSRNSSSNFCETGGQAPQSPGPSAAVLQQSISCDPKIYGTQHIEDSQKTNLSRPNCLGEFSLDRTRQQQLGRSRVRYLYEPILNRSMSTNITHGFGEFVAKDSEEGIDQILRWIMTMAAPNSNLKKTIHECDFVVWRGTLTRLLVSPYEVGPYDVGIKIACTKYRDVFFIREYDTQAKVRSETNRSDYQRRMCYAGFKFEQIVTVDDIGQKPDTTSPVDQNNEFIGIFKATLNTTNQSRPPAETKSEPANKEGGGTEVNSNGIPPNPSINLLFGAEIDCISPLGQYMEIKTQYRTMGHGKGFPSKALKWWIQSYLIGIKQLVVGFHENFILNRIELFPVDSLVKSFADYKAPVCFAFLHSFLHTLKRALDSMAEGTILVAERAPNSHQFKFQLFGPESESADADEYRVISNLFKVHGWK